MPVVPVKLPGQAAALDLAHGAEQGLDVLLGRLKGHVAHQQLGSLVLLGGCLGRSVRGCRAPQAEPDVQLVLVQEGPLRAGSSAPPMQLPWSTGMERSHLKHRGQVLLGLCGRPEQAPRVVAQVRGPRSHASSAGQAAVNRAARAAAGLALQAARR